MLRDRLKKLYRHFISRKITVSLIAVLSLLYFLGLVIPQKQLVSPEEFAAWQGRWPLLVSLLDTLRFTTIYSSPLVTFLTIAFFLNLLIVTYRRFPVVVRELKGPVSGEVDPSYARTLQCRELVMTRERLEEKIGELRKKGFRIVRGPASFRGTRNGFSVLGSLFFHLSFIFLLAAGLTIFHTRFWGEAIVTEGQTFNGARPEYRSVGRFSDLRTTLPKLHFTLEKVEPRFEKMEAVSLKSTIRTAGEGGGKTHDFDVNFPYRQGSTTMLVIDAGAAPYMRVTNAAGKELFGAYVTLNIIRGKEDTFRLPGTGYEFRVRFWPDFGVDEKGYVYTRSYHLRKPLFVIEIARDGVPVASGRLEKPQDSIVFDGMRLSYADVRHFGRFLITDEKGGGLLVIGFVLAIVGLVLKFGWQREEIVGVFEGDENSLRLVVGYKAEYYKGLGSEKLERLLSGLR